MHLFCKCKIPDFKSSLKVDVLCCAALNRSVMSDSLQPLGLQPARFLCPWDFPGKNTGVGMKIQGIFLIQQLNQGLLCCSWILYQLSYQIRSDQISRSVVSDSLRPHESQNARPPCPSPTPGVH